MAGAYTAGPVRSGLGGVWLGGKHGRPALRVREKGGRNRQPLRVLVLTGQAVLRGRYYTLVGRQRTPIVALAQPPRFHVEHCGFGRAAGSSQTKAQAAISPPDCEPSVKVPGALVPLDGPRVSEGCRPVDHRKGCRSQSSHHAVH